MNKKTFILREEHLILLRNMYVSWWDCEYGAPSINCKRPYGNSDVIRDIAEILELRSKDDDSDLTEEQEKELDKLHLETKIALQIVLQNINQEIKLGEYETIDYSSKWNFAK